MRQSIRLGMLHGIPVAVHWSTLVIMVLLVQLLAVGMLPAAAAGYPAAAYWLAATGFAGLFLGGLLAHEYAHARVAQHYGVRVRSITLWMLGGMSELDGDAPHARADLLTALAGPGASLLGAAAALLAGELSGAAGAPLVAAGFVWLAMINAFLGIVNLLPGGPLDGGRVLAAVIWRVRGDRAAGRRAAAYAGIALGAVTAGAGIVLALVTRSFAGLWIALLGWYLASTHLTVVLDGSRPCGVLTSGDLGRALAVAHLGEVPDRCPSPIVDPFTGR